MADLIFSNKIRPQKQSVYDILLMAENNLDRDLYLLEKGKKAIGAKLQQDCINAPEVKEVIDFEEIAALYDPLYVQPVEKAKKKSFRR